MSGVLIVFEGGEGAGKTTQMQALANRLRRAGRTVVTTHEPGGTPLGDAARSWLKEKETATPLTELFLVEAARAEHVARIIKPTLARNAVVVCDRFTASTIAYQAAARGLPRDLVDRANAAASQGVKPDLQVLLDVPPETGLARKGADTSVFERAGLPFHQAVRASFMAQAKAEPYRWLVLDSRLPQEIVEELVWHHVEVFLSGHGGEDDSTFASLLPQASVPPPAGGEVDEMRNGHGSSQMAVAAPEAGTAPARPAGGGGPSRRRRRRR